MVGEIGNKILGGHGLPHCVALVARIARVIAVVADKGNRALVAKLDGLEFERTGLVAERAATADRTRLKQGRRRLTANDVDAILEFGPLPLKSAEVVVRRAEEKLIAHIGKIEKRIAVQTTDGLLIQLTAIGQAVGMAPDTRELVSAVSSKI